MNQEYYHVDVYCFSKNDWYEVGRNLKHFTIFLTFWYCKRASDDLTNPKAMSQLQIICRRSVVTIADRSFSAHWLPMCRNSLDKRAIMDGLIESCDLPLLKEPESCRSLRYVHFLLLYPSLSFDFNTAFKIIHKCQIIYIFSWHQSRNRERKKGVHQNRSGPIC